ncbi:fimbrial protein [Lelliottia nimipressuralis]|uniref:fimbrial protein n=1 Tax=Lelliottia nimipressuralis TaxID=69220 RepID=UPI0028A0934F|nr:fimbrial protein [Lelliottia nimipressuralis]
MKKLNTYLVSLLCVAPLSSFAADGDITFTGKVTASACTLKGFNGMASTSSVMALTTVSPESFNGAGGYAGMKDFTIDLQDCDITTMKNARVAFSGTPDTLDNEILKNTETNGPADGVGVAILENDGISLVDINGGMPSKSQALSAGDTELKFKVAYKANTATPAVTPGNVKAKTFVDITYN